MVKFVYEIQPEDLGKITLQLPACPHCGERKAPICLLSIIGRVQAIDIGKRVYQVLCNDGVHHIYQIENSEQLAKRRFKAA